QKLVERFFGLRPMHKHAPSLVPQRDTSEGRCLAPGSETRSFAIRSYVQHLLLQDSPSQGSQLCTVKGSPFVFVSLVKHETPMVLPCRGCSSSGLSFQSSSATSVINSSKLSSNCVNSSLSP